MPADIERLRGLCQGATPGEWTPGDGCVYRADGKSLCEVWVRSGYGAQAAADAAYIAALNPVTVAALLSELAAARACIDRLKARTDYSVRHTWAGPHQSTRDLWAIMEKHDAAASAPLGGGTA